jgi:hypothetical protein
MRQNIAENADMRFLSRFLLRFGRRSAETADILLNGPHISLQQRGITHSE